MSENRVLRSVVVAEYGKFETKSVDLRICGMINNSLVDASCYEPMGLLFLLLHIISPLLPLPKAVGHGWKDGLSEAAFAGARKL